MATTAGIRGLVGEGEWVRLGMMVMVRARVNSWGQVEG